MACEPIRILVCEDEAFIAWDIEQMLEGAGFEVVGPAPSLAAGLERARSDHACAAVLDINLGKDTVWPLAETLVAGGIPIMFVSANFSHDEIAGQFRDVPRLSKPVREADLLQSVEMLVSQSPCRAGNSAS